MLQKLGGLTQTLLAQIKPFDATATTPASSLAGSNVLGPQSAYSDGSLNQPFNPALNSNPSRYSQSAPGESGIAYGTDTWAQPTTGKAALIARQHQNAWQPPQHEDSGIRINEQGPGPSQIPPGIPPSYTPD